VDQLTPDGLKVVNELAQRFGFSQEAVIQMMFAMLRGRGAMAQFNHPEFAGSGQWMRGGMLMIGDLFNHSLKARVDGLCQAIAAELANQPELFPMGSVQSQSQSGGEGHGLFAPDPRDTWWPRELGTPSAIGSQNDMRYAFFPSVGRLAVEVNGRVTLYDTGEHHIAGFSQQQGPGGAVVFRTPEGSVSLSSLTSIGGLSQQAQSSGGGSQQQQQVSTGLPSMGGLTPLGGMAPMAPMAGMAPMAFAPMAPVDPWWPAELGSPSATGAQNDLRYALFPVARCLVVEVHGRRSVHDIGELQISGCSLASDAEGGARFTTNAGTIPLASLPEVRLGTAASPAAVPAAGPAVAVTAPAPADGARDTTQADVLDALAKLGELKEKGILTEEEFASKKAELLRRL
jgi:hypothetical protein